MFVGYMAAMKFTSTAGERWFQYDWSNNSIFLVGIISFTVSIIVTLAFQIIFSINEAGSESKVSSTLLVIMVFFRMFGNVGEILLSYASVKSNNKSIRYIVYLLILLKLLLGLFLILKR